jgi:hypothetical protein
VLMTVPPEDVELLRRMSFSRIKMWNAERSSPATTAEAVRLLTDAAARLAPSKVGTWLPI